MVRPIESRKVDRHRIELKRPREEVSAARLLQAGVD
jgi:hypothetical protein